MGPFPGFGTLPIEREDEQQGENDAHRALRVDPGGAACVEQHQPARVRGGVPAPERVEAAEHKRGQEHIDLGVRCLPPEPVGRDEDQRRPEPHAGGIEPDGQQVGQRHDHQRGHDGRDPRRDGRHVAERFGDGRDGPEEQRGLFEIGFFVDAEGDGVARFEHFARDLRIPRFVGGPQVMGADGGHKNGQSQQQ